MTYKELANRILQMSPNDQEREVLCIPAEWDNWGDFVGTPQDLVNECDEQSYMPEAIVHVMCEEKDFLGREFEVQYPVLKLSSERY